MTLESGEVNGVARVEGEEGPDVAKMGSGER